MTAISLGCSDGGTEEGAEGGQPDAGLRSSSVGGQTGASSKSSVAGSSNPGSSSSGGSVGGSSSEKATSSPVGGSTDTGGKKTGGTTGIGTTHNTGGGTASTGGTTTSTQTGGGTGGKATDGTGGKGGTSGSGGAKGGATGTGPGNSTDPKGYLVPARKYFGNIDTRGSIRTDFASMWDQFSPENAGKWDSVQGKGEGTWNWSSLDAMHKYCNENGILFKEHTFCWGPQQPSWVNDSNGEKAVKAWMKAFCERYPDVSMIDVFNESLHNSPKYKNGIGGTGTTGYDWLVNAFKWAREACPNAVLLYNDYNTIEYANENGGVIKLVNAIKKAGAPIDGVGCQAHDIGMVSSATATGYVDKIIKETGLPVYITELDVGKADDQQQLASIKGFVEPLWNNDMVKGWTYWGYLQGATWRSNTHLLLSSGGKRAALTWILDFTKKK